MQGLVLQVPPGLTAHELRSTVQNKNCKELMKVSISTAKAFGSYCVSD